MSTNTQNHLHTLYCCYIDESGTSALPGTSSHFVLAGLSIPIYKWKSAEKDIDIIKKKYGLSGKEIHTGWLIRKFKEQESITNFKNLSLTDRKNEVNRLRSKELYALQKKSGYAKQLKQIKKNFRQTEDYIHLTYQERRDFVLEVAKMVGSWGFARLFAECVDKTHYPLVFSNGNLDEHCFEQIVTRFEMFLKNKGSIRVGKGVPKEKTIQNYGMLIHDNNLTIEKKHTDLMKKFHIGGTAFTSVDNIIETPLFVNSSLTSMIQLTDVCAYAIRRYLENNEDWLFNEIYKRADTKGTHKVGIRHFTATSCKCLICKDHTGVII